MYLKCLQFTVNTRAYPSQANFFSLLLCHSSNWHQCTICCMYYMHICSINSLVVWMVQLELNLKNIHNLMLMVYNHRFSTITVSWKTCHIWSWGQLYLVARIKALLPSGFSLVIFHDNPYANFKVYTFFKQVFSEYWTLNVSRDFWQDM